MRRFIPDSAALHPGYACFEKEMKAAELQWESDAQSPQLPPAAAPQAQKG
jgi:hypothetical protein